MCHATEVLSNNLRSFFTIAALRRASFWVKSLVDFDSSFCRSRRRHRRTASPLRRGSIGSPPSASIAASWLINWHLEA